MVEKSSKLIWGVVAVLIYIILVGLLIFYFNTRNSDKSKHYVKKDEHRIQVALSRPKNEKRSPLTSKVKPLPTVTKKKKIKNKVKIKDRQKKYIKEKVVKKILKRKDENLTNLKKYRKKTEKKAQHQNKKQKKKKTVDLFSNIQVKKKNIEIKITDTPVKAKKKHNIIKVMDIPPSASERITQSLKKQKSSDSGVENAYFAKVQRMLEAWPARGDFIGEEATVTLYIKPTGMFEFQVTSGSSNEAFANSIMDFLSQLQKIGFGKHSAGRAYEFEVEFSTKE